MKLLLTALLTALSATAHAAAKGAMHGSELQVRWADLIGETVRLRVTPTRALGPARYLVSVDGTKAIMLIGPSKVWSGTRTVCAGITGPESLPDKGRTTVIGLMLNNCEEN